jgi:predicted transcriptional regulator
VFQAVENSRYQERRANTLVAVRKTEKEELKQMAKELQETKEALGSLQLQFHSVHQQYRQELATRMEALQHVKGDEIEDQMVDQLLQYERRIEELQEANARLVSGSRRNVNNPLSDVQEKEKVDMVNRVCLNLIRQELNRLFIKG